MGNESFEHKIKQLLDSHQTAPSEELWHAIEARIDKKERKNRWLLWLLPLFFVAGAIFFIAEREEGYTKASAVQHEAAPVQNESAVQLPAQTTDETPAAKNIRNKNTIAAQPQHLNRPVIRTIKKNEFTSAAPVNKNNIAEPQQSTIQNNHQSNIISSPSANDSQPGYPDNDVAETETAIQTNIKDSNNTLQKDIAATEKQLQDSTIKTFAAPKSNKSKTKKYPWQLSVSITAGKSSTMKPVIHDVVGNYDVSIWQSPNPFRPTPDIWLPESTPATGFAADVELQKKLSSHFDISTGLSYQQLSTKIKTGLPGKPGIYENPSLTGEGYKVQVDQLFYPGGQSGYTNKYHFLQLPIQAGYTFDINAALQLRAYSGLQIQQLISSNTLFTDTSGYSFETKGNLHKTLFGVNAGLDIVLFKDKPFSFALGPYWQQSLSLLHNNTTAGKQRPAFYGLKISYFILKSKK